MPTSRKRIGYLPSTEVQKLINKICVRNNLSQSKVTGILVEEALKARNLCGIKNQNALLEEDLNDDSYKTKIPIDNEFNTNKYDDLAEDQEYKLIKDYLNFKKFKEILLIVQSEE